MKKTLLILCSLLTLIGHGQKRDSVTYIVYKPELGYLVGYDSTKNFWYVQRIYKVETYQLLNNLPCSTVYYWHSDNKDSTGWYSHGEKYDSSKDYGPCGYSGIFMAFSSEYEGDSIVSHDCWRSSFSLYKTEYYQPAKSKEWELGEKYELKPNEHFADYKLWYPKPFIIMCV